MTDWIEHNGGPQPVDDDVWVEASGDDVWVEASPEMPWDGPAKDYFWSEPVRYRILNQHLIDAARLEGIRLGLEAATTHLTEGGWVPEIRDLNPDTIAREADQ